MTIKEKIIQAINEIDENFLEEAIEINEIIIYKDENKEIHICYEN